MEDNHRESGFQILHCSEDDLVPEENADQLHEAISGSSKMVFPKGRHDMQVTLVNINQVCSNKYHKV